MIKKLLFTHLRSIVILYEHPFNERIRTYLRLEYLLERFEQLLLRSSEIDHHFALTTLFEIVTVFYGINLFFGHKYLCQHKIYRKLTKCGHLEVKTFHLVSLILSL